MKKFLILLVLLSFLGCSDDDGPKDKNGLPVATQTGENTFGCLVNGKRYTPSGYFPYPKLEATYDDFNGDFYLRASRRVGADVEGIVLGSRAFNLSEGQTYQLLENEEGNASGGWFVSEDFFGYAYTGEQHTGELTITNYDEANHILSGLFWFDVLLPNGEVVEIREGRFDVKIGQPER